MRILDKTRKEYKKKFKDKTECVFCREKDPFECCGLNGRYWRVFATKYPYMDGNVMIVPRRHVESTADIKGEEWEEFGDVLSKTQEVLGKIFKVKSFNIGMNIGPESGASIPHLHWQVVPRKFENITVMNSFANLYVVAMPPEEVKKKIDVETL